MEVIRGSKVNSTFYAAQANHVYIKDILEPNVLYLKCRMKTCRGRAVSVRHNRHIRMTHRHSHFPCPVELDKLRLLERLCQRAREELITIRQIYQQEIMNFTVGATRLGYPKARRAMNEARSRTQPRRPQSLMDVQVILSDAAWENWASAIGSNDRFFRSSGYAPDGSTFCIFVSPGLEHELTVPGITLMIDATFKTVPNHTGASQLLTIHVVIREHVNKEVYACAYILMSSKSQIAYETVLRALSDEVGGILPAHVLCDFEASLRLALRAVFIGVDVQGCWFHFSNANHKQAIQWGLRQLLSDSEDANKALRCFMSLPLCPEDYHSMRDAFNSIVAFIRGADLYEAFHEYLVYFEDQWFTAVPPEDWSVYRRDIRTNNIVERFHLTLLHAVSERRHPNFWIFYNTLRSLDFEQGIKRQQRNNGITVQRGVIRRFRILNRNIMNLWNEYENGQLDIPEFVQRASYLCGGLHGRLNAQRLRVQLHPEGNGINEDNEDEPEVQQQIPPQLVDGNNADLLNQQLGQDIIEAALLLILNGFQPV